ncbi:MAG: hypothetical protein CMF75_06700 [Maricaulis sp.]|nr:hypothetical protein [Maricaulis sp.]|tara:strand:- start:46 stop:459 length:414 start_codon:yes stop_codon:yes gene_type:complete
MSSLSWRVMLPLTSLSALVASYWIVAYWLLTHGPTPLSLPLASQDAATGAPPITIFLGHACMLAFWIALVALILKRPRLFLTTYLAGAAIRATSWIFQTFNPDFPSQIGFFQIGLEATVVWLFLRWRQEANTPNLAP